MRILLAHNYYQQAGGEDSVFKAECELLKSKGEEVFLFERNNADIEKYSLWQQIDFLCSFDSSRRTYREFRKYLREICPDVIHVHNIFYLLTPSIYRAAHDEGIPVVQTQHNFRPLCANALFFRDNKVCELCLETGSFRPAVRYRCFKNSWFMSAMMAKMLTLHKQKKTWQTDVDRYIVLSEFSRQKYISAGIPTEKISVKPNFVGPPVVLPKLHRNYGLYVGRLSEEKGISFLLKAWESIPDVELKIVGEGPLSGQLQALVKGKNMHNVSFLGYIPEAELGEVIHDARFVIVPSLCYENFPKIIAFAYSYGVPVIASRLGSMPELVEDGQTGLTFAAGDEDDLSEKVRRLAAHPKERDDMGQKARRVFDQKFTAPENYAALMAIYHQTIAEYRHGK